MRKHTFPIHSNTIKVTYHREPTPSEIRFGEGATHYRDFAPGECCHLGTRILKCWLTAPDDGLRYYR